MKVARKHTQFRAHCQPKIRFENHALTSFAGLAIIQKFLGIIRLKRSLRGCFSHMSLWSSFGLHTVFLALVVHVLLGWKRLRDINYYRHDPMVARVLGIHRLPDVSTISRFLKAADEKAVRKVSDLITGMVASTVAHESFRTLTLDYDGSVLSTKARSIEGTAIGYNKKSKGSRSYYPLFCTVSQTGQVLKARQRAGNVHDSNGALPFVKETVSVIRKASPRSRVEIRMDSAHFNDNTISWLEDNRVEFSVSVPFARFSELKIFIEERSRWKRIDKEWSFFEKTWKPKSWKRPGRFLFFRRRLKKPRRGPIQLDFFHPAEFEFEYKVVVTNKTNTAPAILAFHNGRGAQEGIFADLKTHCGLGYIPTRRRAGNTLWMLANVLAHNLHRQLQMIIHPNRKGTTSKRECAFHHEKICSFRKNILQRAGRFTKPSGVLTLTVAGGRAVKKEFMSLLSKLDSVA